jgi:thiol:disulfide interchange protein DsbD
LRADAIRPARLLRLVPAAALLVAALCGAAGLPTVEPKLLPPEEAFRFSARALDDRTIEARFDVADGYYLYRDKFGFEAAPADLGVGVPVLPAGVRKHDAFFGDVETYRGRVVIRVPLARGAAGQAIVLKAASQGCADAGVCYPPSVQQVTLALRATGVGPGPIVEPTRRKGLFN